MVRDTWHHCLYSLGLSINCGEQRRPLHGLNIGVGWPIRLIALVKGLELLNQCIAHANPPQESGLSTNHGTSAQ